MSLLKLFIGLSGVILALALPGSVALAEPCDPDQANPMQHGFVLSLDGSHAFHLVAGGHHGRQTVLAGNLEFESQADWLAFRALKRKYGATHYFLFQAQDVDLPCVAKRNLLLGHLVMSEKGEYQPEEIVLRNLRYRVHRVLLNLDNPFL